MNGGDNALIQALGAKKPFKRAMGGKNGPIEPARGKKQTVPPGQGNYSTVPKLGTPDPLHSALGKNFIKRTDATPPRF